MDLGIEESLKEETEGAAVTEEQKVEFNQQRLFEQLNKGALTSAEARKEKLKLKLRIAEQAKQAKGEQVYRRNRESVRAAAASSAAAERAQPELAAQVPEEDFSADIAAIEAATAAESQRISDIDGYLAAQLNTKRRLLRELLVSRHISNFLTDIW